MKDAYLIDDKSNEVIFHAVIRINIHTLVISVLFECNPLVYPLQLLIANCCSFLFRFLHYGFSIRKVTTNKIKNSSVAFESGTSMGATQLMGTDSTDPQTHIVPVPTG